MGPSGEGSREAVGTEPIAPAAPVPSPLRLRCFALAFYMLLTLAGMLWSGLRVGRYLPPTIPGRLPFASLTGGVAVAVGVVGLGWMILRYSLLAKWLACELRRLVGPMDSTTILILALASGVGEEVFFRGAMQPVLGLGLTSVLFGALHVGPDRRYLVWTAFAIAMGFLLGWLLLATGSLLGPILVHVVVNYLNLRRIAALHPRDRSLWHARC